MPELITGTKGTPHVTSTQDRSIYEKIIGKGSYILDDNELLEPELQSNQSLRIRSGMLYHHGSITEVKRNTYDEVTIANGSQGMKRIDLVVARYTKNPETEIEEMNWVVIQGTPAANDPVAPSYTEGNMQEGDLTDDCPVFEVHLDGIQVTEVVKLLKVLDGSLEALNSKMIDTGWVKASANYNFYYRKVINTVWVWCYSTDEYEISGTNKNLFTLPEDFRPGRWIQTVGSLRQPGQGANTQIEVSSSGVVSVCTLGQTARKLWSALLCFPTAP